MAGRRMSATEVRDRRAKKRALVLGVLFLVVVGIQGPKLLKQLHPHAQTTAINGGTAPAVATTGTTVAASATAGATPAAAAGQLHDFSRLPLKDPFHALVQEPKGTAGASAPGQAQATATPKKKTAAETVPTGPVAFTSQVPAPDAALIRTNGRRQIVAVGAPFPSSQPVFKLVALGKKGVRIGVLGGSFTSGIPTLLLPKGHTITLANQADGSRYVLELVRLTTAPLKPTAPTAVPTTTTASG